MNANDIQKFLHDREKNRLQIYENILQKCYLKIQNSVLRDEEFTIITIPDFIIGYPTYNFQNCIKYVIFKLKQNKFEIKYFYPNALQIIWGKKDFNSLLNNGDVPQTEVLAIESSKLFDKKPQKQNNKKGKDPVKSISNDIYRPDLMVNNSALPGSSTYKNNISLNFSKKTKKEKEKDNFKDINNFMPKTNIFSKFK